MDGVSGVPETPTTVWVQLPEPLVRDVRRRFRWPTADEAVADALMIACALDVVTAPNTRQRKNSALKEGPQE